MNEAPSSGPRESCLGGDPSSWAGREETGSSSSSSSAAAALGISRVPMTEGAGWQSCRSPSGVIEVEVETEERSLQAHRPSREEEVDVVLTDALLVAELRDTESDWGGVQQSAWGGSGRPSESEAGARAAAMGPGVRMGLGRKL